MCQLIGNIGLENKDGPSAIGRETSEADEIKGMEGLILLYSTCTLHPWQKAHKGDGASFLAE